MARVSPDPNLPAVSAPTFLARLTDAMRALGQQLNGISENAISAKTNANVGPPTGTVQAYAQGDFTPNSAPTELGSAGSKYVVIGWTCVAAGAPGTWVQCRTLTGN